MTPDVRAFFKHLYEQHSLDGFLCTQREDIRYLTSFSGSDGVAICCGDEVHFLSDSRYTQQAGSEVTADRISQYSAKIDGIKTVLGRRKQRIGFHPEAVSVAFFEKLKMTCGDHIEWVPVAEGVKPLRMVKTAAEIELLRSAAQLNARGFAAIEPMLVAGTRERDIAMALEFELRRLGGEEKAFDYIVASGHRGAMPHGVASDKALAAGELVTIDFGTRISGYYSDETVTVGLGEVPKELRHLHDVVLEAHDRAIAAVEPGIALKELDSIARDYIGSKGFGPYFGHGLGHGVGLEIHEAPVVSQKSEAIAAENMVFTIEPGIYIEGLGGVRIEDTVVVTATGCCPLTVLSKQFHSY